MGQKDMTEKLLEEYNDVFADIYNVLVFKKDVIDENRLRDGTTESVYKAEDGAYREHRRDVMKTYLDEYQMELAFIGIDNQTTVDRYISVRVLGYDYAKYRRQVDEKRVPILPVITLVLNMSGKRWSGCKSLADITKVPAEFEPFFQDYKVMVVDVAFLEDEVIERFTSDFKLVAKFFKNRRLGVEPLEDDSEIKHVTELIDFISVFTNDTRYRNIQAKINKMKEKGEKVTMCYVAQRLLDRGADRMARLISYLLTNNMRDELEKVLSDEEIREEMYEKYGIEVAS